MNLFELAAKITLDTGDYEREIGNVGSKTKSAAESISKSINSIASGTKNAFSAISDGFEKLSDGFQKVSNVGRKAADAVVAGVGGVVGAATAVTGSLLALESSTEEYRIAQGKLNTAFEAAGFSAASAQQAYNSFYGILGDTDTATEASQLLAKLALNAEDISVWTDIAAGVYGTFGDALPIEGLIESANETARVGQVTGSLADALNWASISEDEFNDKLEACSSESERNQLIMETLSGTYDEASAAFYRNNEAIIQARNNQAMLDEATASLGETVSIVKNRLMSEFLPAISDVIVSFGQMIEGVKGADEVFADAVSEIVEKAASKLPEFLEFGTKIVGTIASAIFSNAPVIVQAMTDAIVMMLGSIGAHSEEITNAGRDIIQYIKNGFTNIVDAVLPMVDEFVSLIASGFATYAETLFTVGLDIITAIIDGIAGNIDSVVETGQEMILNIAASIEENLSKIIDAAEMIIPAVVDGITELLPELIPAAISVLTQLVTAISDNIDKIADGALQIITSIGEGLADALPELVPAVVDMLLHIVDVIIENLPLIAGVGVDIIGGLVEGLIKAIPDIIMAIPKVITALIDGFKSLLGIHSPSTVFAEIGVNLINGLLKGISETWETIVEFFTGAVEALKTFFAEAWESIKQSATEAWEAIKKVLSDAWAAVRNTWSAAVEFFSGIWEGISGIFGGAADWFGGIFSSAWNAITSAWDGTVSYFSGLWDGVVGVFNGVWDTFTSIGRDIVDGLKDGVANAWGTFMGWLESKVGGIISGVKSMLGIRSPSTVFAGIGGNMALGLVKGWDDEYSGIKKQIEDGMKFGTANVDVSATGTYSGRYGAGMTGGGDTYNFYSPKALDPVTAAREMKRAKQQMALGYI